MPHTTTVRTPSSRSGVLEGRLPTKRRVGVLVDDHRRQVGDLAYEGNLGRIALEAVIVQIVDERAARPRIDPPGEHPVLELHPLTEGANSRGNRLGLGAYEPELHIDGKQARRAVPRPDASHRAGGGP